MVEITFNLKSHIKFWSLYTLQLSAEWIWALPNYYTYVCIWIPYKLLLLDKKQHKLEKTECLSGFHLRLTFGKEYQQIIINWNEEMCVWIGQKVINDHRVVYFWNFKSMQKVLKTKEQCFTADKMQDKRLKWQHFSMWFMNLKEKLS